MKSLIEAHCRTYFLPVEFVEEGAGGLFVLWNVRERNASNEHLAFERNSVSDRVEVGLLRVTRLDAHSEIVDGRD